MERSARTASGERNPKPTHVPGERALRVFLLGRFEISAGSRVIREEEWRLRKAASLVKVLALAPNYHLHREQVMEMLWPDLAPRAAANNLHQALHVARRTLGPGAATFRYLSLQGEQLVLCPDEQLWVDVDAFERATEEARRAPQVAAYRKALDLYAGELLPQDRYEEWTEGRREELRRTYLALLFELAALQEERGDLARAIEALREIVSSEPAHEEAHVGLMRVYARTGQRYQALRQYEQLRQALRRELDTEPHPASRQAYEEILAGHTTPAGPPPAEYRETGVHNLPGSLTSFVGREREKEEVERLLSTSRLLTLTGTGGCGKTRLAQEVARELAEAYPDGVWLAELAPFSEPEMVPQVVADALGVREQQDCSPTDTLVGSLSEKEMLVVLDNCEHLIEAAARLAETLLRGCPRLRILATSREPLGAPGEVILPVPPLSAPGHPLPVEELEGYEAVRLFVERARYRNPAFVLTPQNAHAIAEICGRLDGIPLAVELAAARAGLSVEEIATRLHDSLRWLTAGSRTATPRHRTLRGALDWSHELLSEPEQAMFRRLSVFAGGWTLQAAEATCSGDGIEQGDALDLLSRLVDRSLVLAAATGGGAVRYRLLEPVRQYAREKLGESDETEAVRVRHAAFFLALAEEAEPELSGPNQSVWIERLEAEHPNVQTALEWSLDAAPETALRLTAALGNFWYRYGRIIQGRRWLEAVLARTGDFETTTRARVLRLAGVLSEESGLYGRAEELHKEGLALYRRLGDREGVAASLNSLGALAYAVGDLGRAVALTEESLSLKRELGDEKVLMSSRNNLGEMVQTTGDLSKAQALFEENLASARKWGDEWGAAISLLNLGTLAVEQNEPARAQTLLLDALRTLQRLGDEDAVAECLDSLAGAAGARDERSQAAILFGAAEAAREELGTPIRPVERDRYERFVARSKRGLGERAWKTAWEAGRALSLQQAAEYALAPAIGNALPAEAGGPSTPLTRREREIAALVAQGLTNRRIAFELSISERTVTTHISKILKKLGLRSRAQLATWTTERR